MDRDLRGTHQARPERGHSRRLREGAGAPRDPLLGRLRLSEIEPRDIKELAKAIGEKGVSAGTYAFLRKHPVLVGLAAFVTIGLAFAVSSVLGGLVLVAWIALGGGCGWAARR